MLQFLRFCFSTLILLAGSEVFAIELTSKVDRNRIAIDETLQLTVRYNGNRKTSQPDFSQIEKHFDIISTSQSNQFRSVNGKITSYTDWVLILSPLKQGKLVIPSFRFDGYISDAIEINVTAAQSNPMGSLKDVFVETVVNKESIYVQEQLLIKYRLYYAVSVDSLDAEPLELENVVKETLPDVRYSRTIGGRTYRIAEFSYALFPQNSGKLEIPSLVWDVKIPKSDRNRSFFGFSGRYEINRQRTEKKVIEVRSRPETFPTDKPWIPASALSLEETWSKELADINIGEPITRTITVKAEGLMASQLPQVLDSFESDKIKTYTDQPEFNDDQHAKGLSSTRIESAAVVISASGTAVLPKISVPWWDVASNALRYAEIPERILQTQTPANETPLNNTSSVHKQTSIEPIESPEIHSDINALKTQITIWKGISAALLIIFVSSIWLVIQSQKSPTPKSGTKQHNKNENSAFSSLVKACRTNSAEEIRNNLLSWARFYWHDDSINTLQDVSRHVKKAELDTQLKRLDALLYSNENGYKLDGGELLAVLKSFLKEQGPTSKATALKEFYIT